MLTVLVLILLIGAFAGTFLGWTFLLFADAVFVPAACAVIYVQPQVGFSAVLIAVAVFQIGYVLGGVGMELVRPIARRWGRSEGLDHDKT